MLGREPVVDRQHLRAGVGGEEAAGRRRGSRGRRSPSRRRGSRRAGPRGPPPAPRARRGEPRACRRPPGSRSPPPAPSGSADARRPPWLRSGAGPAPRRRRRPRRGCRRAPGRRSSAARGCRLPASGPRPAVGSEQQPLGARRQVAGELQDPVLDGGRKSEAGWPRRPGYVDTWIDVTHWARRHGDSVQVDCGGGGESSGVDQRARSGEGLPPGPRMPRALQTAIWSRQAQWLLEQGRARFGPMFTIRIAYEGDWVVLADPELVKQVFTGDPQGLPRRRGQPDPAPDPRRELGPRPRREAAHQPAQAAAAALPRRADAGLRREDDRDRRPRDRELADRRPLQAAAADAGDHAGDHHRDRLRRPRAASGWSRCARRCGTSST